MALKVYVTFKTILKHITDYTRLNNYSNIMSQKILGNTERKFQSKEILDNT